MKPNRARFIWTDPEGRGRNRYALFRRSFFLTSRAAADEDPDSGAGSHPFPFLRGELAIFADTRYRLMVNGHVIGHGPGRFFVCAPEYDTYDVGPYLAPGKNVVAVMVNSAGGSSFHNEASVGGLIAWGVVSDDSDACVDLATGYAWRAIDSPGHRGDTPALSFALNPGETLDARLMPTGWETPGYDDSAWPAAVIHAQPDHWGELSCRSIPPLDERRISPRRRLKTFVGQPLPGEEVYSLMVVSKSGRGLHTRGRVLLMTYLHSPRDQEITFGAWWGRYWMNGEELRPTKREDLAFRQDFKAKLTSGWNLLQVYESMHSDWWDFYLALPHQAGLTPCARPDRACPDSFLVGGPFEGDLAEAADRLPLPLSAPEELPTPFGDWTSWPRTRSAGSPCRDRGWLRFTEAPEDLSSHPDVPLLAARAGDGVLSLLFDFGTEVLGRPILHFTAAAGTVVDLTYNERLREDGLADAHFRYFVDMADRYVAREGRQTWQTFHPRGFRYLEVLLHGKLADFHLHDIGLTRANYPVQRTGAFECSDPLLNEIWEMGARTQHACMEDAYLDCPGRERGLYAGDFLVQFFTNLSVFGDVDLFRHCIELFLCPQMENGLVPGNAHGMPPGTYSGQHSDYSAMIPQSMHDYWSRTGDRKFLVKNAPRLARLIEGMESLSLSGSGLLDGSGLSPYIDLSHMDKGGVNCALNCFYEKGFRDAGRIFEICGDGERSRRCQDRADGLRNAIREEFWDEERGLFVDRLRSQVPTTEPSVPANALALFYGIATPEQAERAVEWLADAMLHNFRTPDPQANADCNVTSYFSFYALGALYRHHRAEAAAEFIRRYWGRMIDAGAWTCWEYFLDGEGASRCHAWSSSPTHYLSTAVLGVQFPDPGNLNRVCIQPHPGDLAWAQGVYPLPAGPLRISWEKKNGRLDISWTAPPGVDVVKSLS